MSVMSNEPSKPRGRARGLLVVLLVVFVGFAALVAVRVKQAVAKKGAVERERTEVVRSAGATPVYATVRAEKRRMAPEVETTGTLRPWREAEVGFETQGRVLRVLVSAGEKVRAGATLALLDQSRASEIVSIKEASARAAEANLSLAKDALSRVERLSETQSVSEASLEQARQQVLLARAQVEAARGDARLARSGQGLHAIVAPFDGTVTRAPQGVGHVVQPGTALVRVEDLSRFRLSVTVGEEDVGVVHVGNSARVRYRDKEVLGTVRSVVPSLDPATRRAPVEIEVPNTGALLGFGFVHVTMVHSEAVEVLYLPVSVKRPGADADVFVFRDGKAHKTRIAYRVHTDGGLLVESGISEMDSLLVSPSAGLVDGDEVRVGTP